MKKSTKILICYNEPYRYFQNYTGKHASSGETGPDASETDTLEQISVIERILRGHYNQVLKYPFRRDISRVIDEIAEMKPDLIFNLVESVDGNAPFESFAAGVFDLMKINYTGNTSITLGICLDKARTKQILKSFGINTPSFKRIKHKDKFNPGEFSLEFPVICKLLDEDASIGISEFSVVRSISALRKRVSFLKKNYSKDIIIETYIEGREFNVGILGGSALPVSEISFEGLPQDLPRIVTYEGKWLPESIYFKNTNPVCPAELDKRMSDLITEIALESYNAMGCRDYARIDIRLDRNNIPYVIEVNPNPDISMNAGFANAAKAGGIDYEGLIIKLSELALKRMGHDSHAAA